MRHSEFNISIKTKENNTILLNYFRGVIDQIDEQLEEYLFNNDFNKIEESEFKYLQDRGYIVQDIDEEELEFNYDLNYELLENQSVPVQIKSLKNPLENILVSSIIELDFFDIKFSKVLIADELQNCFLLEDKENIINFYLQRGIVIEVNLYLKMPLIEDIDNVFKFALKKGWIFLSNFSLCFLPEEFSGCSLGKTFNFDLNYVTDLLNIITKKKYLQYFSFRKLIGANLIEDYLWNRIIFKNRTFCNYYMPSRQMVTLKKWLTCTNCTLNNNKKNINYNINNELKRNSVSYFSYFENEVFGGR